MSEKEHVDEIFNQRMDNEKLRINKHPAPSPRLCPHDYLTKLGPRCLECWQAKDAAHLALIEELTNSLKDTYEMASYVGGARCKEIEDLLAKSRALLGGGNQSHLKNK